MFNNKTLYEMSPFRKEQIRKQISRAILKFPTRIELLRDEIEVNRYKEKKRTKINLGEQIVFIDRDKSYINNTIKSDVKGNVDKLMGDFYLFAVYESDDQFRYKDYFFVNGIKHIVKHPKNMNDIYWRCDLEVIQEGKEVGAANG